MLLKISETFSNTVITDMPAQLTCDLSLTEAILEQYPQEGPYLYKRLQKQVPPMWRHLVEQISDNPWIRLHQEQQRPICFSVVLTTNSEIQQFNTTFREKNEATDVLTFTLLDEAMVDAGFQNLPELNLGEIYISVAWAADVICKQIESNLDQSLNFLDLLTLFILERLVHGCLHLLGVHHDTMSDYNKVVEIQRSVLHAIT